MSAMTINAISSVNQGFSTNPSVRLNRRGRLARTLVVLSLAIVAVSVAGGKAGAETTAPQTSAHFATVTVAPGETLWALANQLSDGRDVRGLVADIVEINSLSTVDLSAGQKIRIPLK